MQKQSHRSAKRQLISAFVFSKQIVKSLSFLNPKFQASNHLMYLCSLVCVGPGRKPEDRFSHYEVVINFEYMFTAIRQSQNTSWVENSSKEKSLVILPSLLQVYLDI